ncbi:MAG: methyltransferase domain-containing protein [Methanoregula sp.]|jgi:ubiquinone/menaquinone biosynthesis C-methylase UbiE|uniref:methyltransferase domain-containing protein n=1 Tax=Methanoregula sp. TaxID=2052170 RepID=UPI0025E33EBD|nr:methyltransferase domain-containing protein [Methanoregula sp.]MCK9631228.1 methyltransferase domain-containing protein [Methanoregula sp.]
MPEPSRQSLATGFRDVDSSGDTTACHRCLDLIAGIPSFREVKEESIRIVADTNPSRVLDAGCGAGADLVSLARHLPDRCHVMGLDASGSLLACAAERTGECPGRCSLVRGDITRIPCKGEVFDACRIDRVLQHLRDPGAGVHELTRILKPGGMLVAFDNDWDTFSISLDDHDHATRISRSWRDSFASGRVGRDLHRLFEACGITAIRAEPQTIELTDLSIAKQVFDLPDLMERMVRAGTLGSGEAAVIWEELIRKARKGMFSAGYTGYLVRGTKPG